MKILYFIIAICLIAISCSKSERKITGNGEIINKQFSFEDFSQVETNGQFNVSFVQDSLWKVKIEAESNILPLINIFKTGNKLIIEQENDYSFELNHPIEIQIHHSGITKVDFSGDGALNFGQINTNTFTNTISGLCNAIGFIKSEEVDFILSGSGIIDVSVDSYDLEASLSGTGDLKFAGKSHKGIFTIAGTGNIIANNLLLDYAWCNISGNGNATLNVSKELNANITGFGDITYKGDAVVKDKSITGTGSVSKIN